MSTFMALNLSGRVSVRLAWEPSMERETMRVAGGVSMLVMSKTSVQKSNIQLEIHILKMP